MSGRKKYICKIEARDALYAIKIIRGGKSGINFARQTNRGLAKPIVCSGPGAHHVATKIVEKTSKRKKGEKKESIKYTTYARYAYGLDRIPEGWVIWHIDGDPFNNKIENLECISKDELVRRMRSNKGKKNP
jgi:hypothetical protein